MKINRIICLSLLSVTQIFALTIYDLKDTYNILNDKFRHLSPVNGAVLWQTKAIQNLYDYGNYELKGAIAESGDTDPKDLKIFKQTETVKLLNFELFNRVQGSFNITMRGQNIARCFTAKTLGTILGFMEKFRAENAAPQAEASSSKGKRPQSPGKKSLFATALKKILNDDAELNTSYTQATAVAEFKLTDAKDKLISKFVNTLTDCLNESGYFVFNKEARQTVPAAPYGFLLGFLYQKAQSRAEIAQFFTALETALGTPITTHDYTSDAWAADTYDAQTIAALKNKNFETMPVQDLIKEYESLAIILLSDVPNLPPPVEYASVSFEGQHFADCVETTIRNLCNIIFYDNGTFNAAKIGAAAADITTYYQKNNELLTAGTTGAHMDWIPVIENQAWVTYNRLVSADHTLVLIADKQPVEHVQGFIHINSSKGLAELSQLFNGAQIEAITLGGHDFTLLKLPHRSFIIVNPAQYKLYEVQPTLRNIIIALNKFLGLNLIPDMPKAFIDHTFNQTHFAALAEKLQWYFSGVKKENLDSFDYAQEFNLKISAENNDAFDINLSRAHGEILPDITKKEAIALGDLEKNIVKAMDTYSDYIFLPNIVALICKNNIAKLIDDYLFWMSWYVQDLVTINGKLRMARRILRDPQLTPFEGLAFNMLATLPIREDLLPQRQALELIMPLHKFKYLEHYFFKIAEKEKNFKLQIYNNLAGNDYRLDEAFHLATDSMSDDDSNIQGTLVDLFLKIIQKTSDPAKIREIINAAKKGLNTHQIGVAIGVFNDLLTEAIMLHDPATKDLITREAIEATKKGILSDDSDTRRSSYILIKKLVEKDTYDIKGALNAAKKGLLDNDDNNKRLAILIFDTLLDKEAATYDPATKNLIITEAIEATKKGILSDNSDTLLTSYNIIKKLVEKDKYDVKEALDAAKKGLIVDYSSSAMHIFDTLLNKIYDPATKDLIIKETIEAANSLMLQDNWYGPPLAVKLFEKLFKKNQGIPQAQEVLPNIKNAYIAAQLKKLLDEYEQKNKP